MSPPRFTLEQADTPRLVDTARELFREYVDAIETDLEYQGFSTELAALPAPYEPPSGALLIASADGAVAGCVAMRPSSADAAEMKRLYARPPFRGLGLGEVLVEALVRRARDSGHRELRLDTLATMQAAHALYRRLGFVEIAPYGENHLPGTRFFSLALAR